MITKLTQDQIELMDEVKDEWIKFALNSGDELDTKAATKGIKWLYKMTGLKEPVCVFVDSPLAVQYAVPLALDLLKGKASGSQVYSQVYSQVGSQVDSQVRSQVDSQVRSQVGSQVDSQVRSQVYSQVRSQVRSQVYSQVRSQVGSQVGSQVYSQVGSQVYSQVRSQVYSQVRSQVGSQVYSQVGSQVDTVYPIAYENLGWASGWMAYCDFFERIGVIKHSDFKKYKDYLKSGVFYGVFVEGLAVMCRRPKATRRDEQARLHNDQKPAIEWRDGFKLWYLHGQAFEEKLWSKIVGQKMTMKDVMKMENADERTMAISMLRPDRLLKAMNAKLINVGQFGTKLYEVPNFMDTGKTEYCMWMQDGSTDREFIEWTPPEIGKQANADLCQAHAFDIPLEDYLLLQAEA